MKRGIKVIVTALMFGLYLGVFSSQVFAQQETVIADKGGKFHIDSPVRVGTTTLEPGMYKVQHITQGSDHLIIFRLIRMGYRNNMGNEQLGEEVARVKCTVDPVARKWKNTRLIVVRDSSGQRVVEAVQITGENVLHKI